MSFFYDAMKKAAADAVQGVKQQPAKTPVKPAPVKILVMDRAFDIIDESNFESYINSKIGVNFLGYLNELVRTETNTTLKKQFTYIRNFLHRTGRKLYVSADVKMDEGSKNLLFRLFNKFHISRYKYNNHYVGFAGADESAKRYSHILNAQNGHYCNLFLTKLSKEYPTLHQMLVRSNFRIDLLPTYQSRGLALALFEQFFNSNCANLAIKTPADKDIAAFIRTAKLPIISASAHKPSKEKTASAAEPEKAVSSQAKDEEMLKYFLWSFLEAAVKDPHGFFIDSNTHLQIIIEDLDKNQINADDVARQREEAAYLSVALREAGVYDFTIAQDAGNIFILQGAACEGAGGEYIAYEKEDLKRQGYNPSDIVVIKDAKSGRTLIFDKEQLINIGKERETVYQNFARGGINFLSDATQNWKTILTGVCKSEIGTRAWVAANEKFQEKYPNKDIALIVSKYFAFKPTELTFNIYGVDTKKFPETVAEKAAAAAKNLFDAEVGAVKGVVIDVPKIGIECTVNSLLIPLFATTVFTREGLKGIAADFSRVMNSGESGEIAAYVSFNLFMAVGMVMHGGRVIKEGAHKVILKLEKEKVTAIVDGKEEFTDPADVDAILKPINEEGARPVKVAVKPASSKFARPVKARPKISAMAKLRNAAVKFKSEAADTAVLAADTVIEMADIALDMITGGNRMRPAAQLANRRGQVIAPRANRPKAKPEINLQARGKGRRSINSETVTPTPECLETTKNAAAAKIIIENTSRKELLEAILRNPDNSEEMLEAKELAQGKLDRINEKTHPILEKPVVKISSAQKPEAPKEEPERQKERPADDMTITGPTTPAPPSPASSWLIKPLSAFKEINLSQFLSPEEIQWLKTAIGENNELKWPEIEIKLKKSAENNELNFDANELTVKLRSISAQLSLSDVNVLNIELRRDVLAANKRMPLKYKILRYLLENEAEIDNFKDKDLVELYKFFAKALNEKEHFVYNQLNDLRYLFREFGDNFLANIAGEYKEFCRRGHLPSKYLYLNNIIGDDSIQGKILNHLAGLSTDELNKLAGLNDTQIGNKLSAQLGENAGSISSKFRLLKKFTGARGISELADAAVKFKNGEKVSMRAVSYADIIGDDSINGKILNHLAGLSADELNKLAGVSDSQIGNKLSARLGENADSIQVRIGLLKKYFREDNLIKLTEKWRELKEKGRIFGFNFFPASTVS